MSGAIIPDPLAKPLTGDLLAVDLRRRRGGLDERVGGHDRLRRGGPAVGGERGAKAGERGEDFPDRQRFADDSGGRDAYEFGGAADERGSRFGGRAHGLGAGLAGEGVGVSGIDHQRARFAHRGRRARPLDRGGRRRRAREDSGNAGSGANSASMRSGRPLSRTPDAAAPRRTPEIGGRRAGSSASGERAGTAPIRAARRRGRTAGPVSPRAIP